MRLGQLIAGNVLAQVGGAIRERVGERYRRKWEEKILGQRHENAKALLGERLEFEETQRGLDRALSKEQFDARQAELVKQGEAREAYYRGQEEHAKSNANISLARLFIAQDEALERKRQYDDPDAATIRGEAAKQAQEKSAQDKLVTQSMRDAAKGGGSKTGDPSAGPYLPPPQHSADYARLVEQIENDYRVYDPESGLRDNNAIMQAINLRDTTTGKYPWEQEMVLGDLLDNLVVETQNGVFLNNITATRLLMDRSLYGMAAVNPNAMQYGLFNTLDDVSVPVDWNQDKIESWNKKHEEFKSAQKSKNFLKESFWQYMNRMTREGHAPLEHENWLAEMEKSGEFKNRPKNWKYVVSVHARHDPRNPGVFSASQL